MLRISPQCHFLEGKVLEGPASSLGTCVNMRLSGPTRKGTVSILLPFRHQA